MFVSDVGRKRERGHAGKGWKRLVREREVGAADRRRCRRVKSRVGNETWLSDERPGLQRGDGAAGWGAVWGTSLTWSMNGVVGDGGRITDRTRAYIVCLLYTSPSPRDRQKSRMPSSA